MTNKISIKAEIRDRVGKGSSRSSRKYGKIPAVIYGNKADPLSVNVDSHSFFMLTKKNESIFTKVCEVEVNGKKEKTLIRDIQYHPVTDIPLHIDFLRVNDSTTITIMIPLKFINEELSPGLKKGGVLNIVSHEIELSCKAESIPENIVIDLSGKEIGDSIHFGSIILPEGCTPSHEDSEFTLAAITAPSALRSDEETVAPTAEAETTAATTEVKTEEKK
jgi:large subunit ribosomal protein L25